MQTDCVCKPYKLIPIMYNEKLEIKFECVDDYTEQTSRCLNVNVKFANDM